MEHKGVSWIIRDGSDKDVDRILKLRHLVFGKVEEDKLTPAFWEWEYLNGPDGRGLIYLVEDQKEIVGHFADLPRRFFIHGESSLGTLSLDLMVHPDYRRKGMFLQLGRYAAQRVQEMGGQLMTAYPIRKETIRGLKKVGWVEVNRLPVLVYPLRFRGILQRYLRFLPVSLLMGGGARVFYNLFWGKRKKGPWGNGLEVQEVMDIDHLFEDFFEKTKALFNCFGIRDRTYMIWRYFKHPTRTYKMYRALRKGEMRGFIVLRKVELLGFNSAVIVDVMALDETTFVALIDQGIAYSQKERVDLLGFMVPESHPYFILLKRQGFLRSPKTFRFMIYSHQTDNRLLAPQQWYVTWGDTDVI